MSVAAAAAVAGDNGGGGVRSPIERQLCILGIALVVATAVFAIPGYLTWDSGTYHLMVRTLFTNGGFSIPNGYPELSSPLLDVGLLVVKNGHLVAQYPEYYTLLSLPFYALFGYRGLMVLNAIAFVGICALIWRMARWFSDDRRAPLAAVSVYAFATYAIEYTQSSFPHLTNSFLICLSVWLVWSVALEGQVRSALAPAWRMAIEGRCFLAGFFLGVGIGVRLDTIFAGLAIGLPLLTFRTLGWRAIVACALGSVPPMLGLVWINAIKFDSFLPFSYGREGGGGGTGSITAYFPMAALFALGVAILVWHRFRPIQLGRRGVAIVLVVFVLALVFTHFGQRLLNGIFQLVVDMRIRPEGWESGLSRSAGGALVYHGSVKKSLLESCPYLILIVIPAVRGLFSGTCGVRWLLWLAPAGFFGFFGYFAWHGGVCWNMRYFNPALPFLAILASHELLRVLNDIPTRRWLFWVSVAMLWGLLVAAFFLLHIRLELQEVVILDGGLFIAALLLVCQAAEWLAPRTLSTVLGRTLGALFVFALVWSSALAIGGDYLLSTSIRHVYLRMARDIQPYIENRALILTYQPNAIWALLDSETPPIIAKYDLGTPQDVIELVEKAIDRHPVYWHYLPRESDATDAVVFDALRSQGIQAELLLDVTKDRPYRLYRLRKHAAA
jgi:hypothetical protein